MSFLIVFLGGGIGAALRHAVTKSALALLGPSFPFGTLVVNVVGSFVMGAVVTAIAGRVDGDAPLRLFLATGILGGFTTFSAYSLDAVALWERGDWLPFALYVIGSVVLAIGALVLGMIAARGLA